MKARVSCASFLEETECYINTEKSLWVAGRQIISLEHASWVCDSIEVRFPVFIHILVSSKCSQHVFIKFLITKELNSDEVYCGMINVFGAGCSSCISVPW